MKKYKKYKEILTVNKNKEDWEVFLKEVDKKEFDFNKFNIKNLLKLEQIIFDIRFLEKFFYNKKIDYLFKKIIIPRIQKEIFILKLKKIDKKYTYIFNKSFIDNLDNFIFSKWVLNNFFIIVKSKKSLKLYEKYLTDLLLNWQNNFEFKKTWEPILCSKYNSKKEKEEHDLKTKVLKRILKNIK